MIRSTNAVATADTTDIELTSIKELNFIDAINADHPHSERSKQPSPSKLMEITHRSKVGVMFLSVMIATGFLFVAARVLAIQSSASSTISRQLRWWWEADLMEIIFQVALLMAIVQCTMNTLGGAVSKRIVVGSILFTWVVLLSVMQAAPESWTQVNNTRLVNKTIDRGGCHWLKERDAFAFPLCYFFLGQH